jgi:acyl-coenzyme A thioesterase PaaI-like protein
MTHFESIPINTHLGMKKGRRVAVCAVDVHQGSSHVATGLFTYLILETTDR